MFQEIRGVVTKIHKLMYFAASFKIKRKNQLAKAWGGGG